jgi:ribosomal protein S18 acetylase RimI-like enzyme
MAEIVRAELDDAAEILALQQLAFQREAALNGDWSLPPLTQTLSEIEAEFATRTFLKACQDGRIIGSVRAWLQDGTCTIVRLAVHPDCQRQALGTQLVHAIEAEFPVAERFELFTGSKSEGNIRLYGRLGYRVFRTGKLAERVEIVFMEKRRDPEGDAG